MLSNGRRLADSRRVASVLLQQLRSRLYSSSSSPSLSDILLDIASEEAPATSSPGGVLESSDHHHHGREPVEQPPLRPRPSSTKTHDAEQPRNRTSCSSVSEKKELPPLSGVLAEIVSDVQSRRKFLQQLKTIANFLSLPGWHPLTEMCLHDPGFTITPAHVVELIRALPDPACALRVYIWASQLPGFEHDRFTRAAIVTKWPGNSVVSRFLDILADTHGPSTPESYGLLIQGYGCAEMVDAASSTFDRMQDAGVTSDVSHFNSLMYILAQNDCLVPMRELYARMLKEGIEPNQSTYNIRIRGYCRAGQVDEAMKAYYEMLKKSFPPDLRTFGQLMQCMCQANKVHRLYMLVAKLPENRIHPNLSLYHAIIEGLCKNGCVKNAEKLVKRVRKRKAVPSPFVCNLLALGFCKESKVVGAQMVVRYMLEMGMLPELEVFNLIIILLFKKGHLRIVFSFVDKLIRRGFVPDLSSYNILIYGLSKNGEVSKALDAWNVLIQFSLPSSKSYRALLRGLYQIGRLTDAVKVFKAMLTKGGIGDASVHDNLLYRLKQAGRVIDAQECTNILNSRRESPDTYIEIFEGSKHG